MALISFKLNVMAMLEYLKTEIPLDYILEKVDTIITGEMSVVEKIKASYEIVKAIIEITKSMQLAGQLTIEYAIEIGTKALDKLLDFGGLIGALVIEPADEILIKLVLDYAYEGIRHRDVITKKDFEAGIRTKKLLEIKSNLTF